MQEEELEQEFELDADEAYERMREDESNMLDETVCDMIDAFVTPKSTGKVCYYKGCPEKFAEHVIAILTRELNLKIFIDEYNNIICSDRRRLEVKCNQCGFVTDTSPKFRDLLTNGHVICNKCDKGDLKLIKK
jgi:hypothetical protein